MLDLVLLEAVEEETNEDKLSIKNPVDVTPVENFNECNKGYVL